MKRLSTPRGIAIGYAYCTHHIADEEIDASPYGSLFELTVIMSHDYHGYGSFATAYDDVTVVLHIAYPEALNDGEPGTYRAF
ncbi:Uncharacterised protein [Slackia heliotrinireducens]|uniref:Uncharacterized protein n=1 Tax=Slackia heliotrinireducens (strain ATCC 29202 / DSM 20476 / NCTC 11029 / RHS 1) TaxID=471855 RepID=C7N5T9_SLAHD|nr:hypothetical protein [Slackia heliotrinireducens]ACV22274.1 hypothetical protein Shel_12460 [Slackia heliotrinireducens DSM 20476]VEH00447.1 Uncharacterised protein [Slackia heliotrinireducens]